MISLFTAMFAVKSLPEKQLKLMLSLTQMQMVTASAITVAATNMKYLLLKNRMNPQKILFVRIVVRFTTVSSQKLSASL